MIKALNIFLKHFTAIKPNETLCMGLSMGCNQKSVHGNNASFQEQLSTVNHPLTQNRLLDPTTHDSPLKTKIISLMLPQNNSLIKNDLLHANSHESESIDIDDLYIAVVMYLHFCYSKHYFN